MRYTIFLFALALGAQPTPPASSNAATLRGKQPCSATVTDNCITTVIGGANYGVVAGAGTGDVLGAASVQSGRVPYGSGTAATITSSSKFAYNDTTGMGLIPPLSLGQNGTAAGKVNFLGSTSGTLPVEVDATAALLTVTGDFKVTGTLTVGDGTVAGSSQMSELAANGTNFRKWLVPDLLTADLTMLFPNTVPSAGQVMLFGAPSSDVSTISWGTPVLSGGLAGTATALATPRAIYGNNFDGSAALTQVIASTYGGTGNGFAKFSGPASTEKTFTLPDANSTILVLNGLVSGTAPIAINTGSDPCPTGTHCAFGTTYKSGYVFNQQTATDRIYIDLPTAAAGLQWCIKNSVVGGTGAAVTGIITVKAQTGDYINNDGTIGSSGGVLSSAGAAGDGACFVASAANHWEVFVGRGTWAP